MGRGARCRWTRPISSVASMPKSRKNRWIRLARIAGVFAVIAIPAVVLPSLVSAASVASISLSGGAGTLTVGGTLYAKGGGAVGVDVTTSGDTQCVRLFENGAPVNSASNPSGSSSWHFDLVAPNSSGAQQMRATAFATSDCHGAWGSSTTSFIADNSGPRISPLVAPAPNAYGWNNASVSILGRANDGGMVGVAPNSIGPRLTRLSNETAGANVGI